MEKYGLTASTRYDLINVPKTEVQMYSLNNSNSQPFHTSGQVAKALRVSVSTLKRWLEENPALAGFRTNASGWRLFSQEEIEQIREHQRRRKREGKTFKPDTLRPVNDE